MTTTTASVPQHTVAATEDLPTRYARHTRNATVVMAVIMCVFAAATVAGVIFGIVELVHLVNALAPAPSVNSDCMFAGVNICKS